MAKKVDPKLKALLIGLVIIGLAALGTLGFGYYKETSAATQARKEAERQAKIAEEARLERERAQQAFLKEYALPIEFDRSQIPSDGKAILADLTGMRIYLIENGETIQDLPIRAKGEENSRYETPTGEYEIDLLEKNHFIASRNIIMPYSLHFFGNFFIHGMPYYRATGKDLQDGPSGGCIRLATEDAQKVYEFTEKGTPLFIIEPGDNFAITDTDTLKRKLEAASSTPEISAEAYLVADLSTGFVYSKHNIDEKEPIYSLGKLMTAVIIDEFFRDDHNITIDSTIDGTPTTSPSVRTGDEFTVTELLNPLILEQDTLTAYSISTFLGSNFFTDSMNKKAYALGMEDTHFSDPAGVESSTVTTARDLFYFLKNIHDRHTYTAKLTRRSAQSVNTSASHAAYTWVNQSTAPFPTPTLYMESVTGEKDDEPVVSSLSIAKRFILDRETPVAVVLLGSTEPEKDANALLTWAVNNF